MGRDFLKAFVLSLPPEEGGGGERELWDLDDLRANHQEFQATQALVSARENPKLFKDLVLGWLRRGEIVNKRGEPIVPPAFVEHLEGTGHGLCAVKDSQFKAKLPGRPNPSNKNNARRLVFFFKKTVGRSSVSDETVAIVMHCDLATNTVYNFAYHLHLDSDAYIRAAGVDPNPTLGGGGGGRTNGASADGAGEVSDPVEDSIHPPVPGNDFDEEEEDDDDDDAFPPSLDDDNVGKENGREGVSVREGTDDIPLQNNRQIRGSRKHDADSGASDRLSDKRLRTSDSHGTGDGVVPPPAVGENDPSTLQAKLDAALAEIEKLEAKLGKRDATIEKRNAKIKKLKAKIKKLKAKSAKS